MGAARYNIKIEQGASFSRSFRIKKNGVFEDLSTWSFSGQVRSRYDSTNALATFTFAQGVDETYIVYSLTPTQTSAIPVAPSVAPSFTLTDCVFDIFGDKGTGVDKVLFGDADIVPRVTNV